MRCFSSGTKFPDWTAAEDAQLRTFYEAAYAGDQTPAIVLAERLGRTLGAVRSRADKLGISRPRAIKGGFCTTPTWAPEEEALLREIYPTLRMRDLLPRFPGRSKSAIFTRANVLGLQSPFIQPWTDDHKRALRIGFDRGLAIADIATALGRKAMSVSKYATNHGLDFGMRPLVVEPVTLIDILALADIALPLPPRVDPRRGRSVRLQRSLARRVRTKEKQQQREAARITGAMLAAELDALIVRIPALGKKRIGQILYNSSNGVEQIRRKVKPTTATIEKVRAFVANPPAEAFKPEPIVKVPSRRRSPARPSVQRGIARAQHEQALRDRATDQVNARRAQAVRRAQAEKARAMLDAGSTPGAHDPVSLKMAFRSLSATREQQEREVDPVEQAKTLLRRRYTPVCSMAVYGGPADRFVVGMRKDLTLDQMLGLAAGLQRAA